MSLILAAVLQAAGSPFPPDLHETSSERAGAFVIEHERFERRGVPIMHMPSAWQKVRLIWSAPDDRVRYELEDNGGALALSATVKPPGGETCLASGPIARYGAQPGTAAVWKAGFPALAALIKGCPGVNKAMLTMLRIAYDAAASDFPAASLRMRAVATQAFGGIAPRCLRFSDRNVDSFVGRECVSWSKDPRGDAPVRR